MIVLGIDPGLNRTGYGLIRQHGSQLSFIDAGVISTSPKAPMAERLLALHDGISQIIRTHNPASAAMEETFVNMNSASSLKLAQARGALLLTLAVAPLPVAEYAANLVKKTVVGNGHADKNQIAMMVRTLLPGCRTATPDACDALAVAITHAQHMHFRRLELSE